VRVLIPVQKYTLVVVEPAHVFGAQYGKQVQDVDIQCDSLTAVDAFLRVAAEGVPIIAQPEKKPVEATNAQPVLIAVIRALAGVRKLK